MVTVDVLIVAALGLNFGILILLYAVVNRLMRNMTALMSAMTTQIAGNTALHELVRKMYSEQRSNVTK